MQETAEGSNYILIQTNNPLTKDIKKELTNKQVVIQEKVSDNTYLCGYKPKYFMVDSHLKQTPASSSPARSLLPIPAPTSHPVTVDVEFQPDVAVTPELIKKVAAAAHLDKEYLITDKEVRKARISVQHRYLSDLAALDSVKSIHEVHTVKLHNNIARTILRADQVVHTVNGTRYEGEDQVVCVSDTKFDKSSCNPDKVADAFKNGNNMRVRALYALSRKSSSDPDGHGTYVCSSVLGDSISKSIGSCIQGTAPKATLVIQSLLDTYSALSGIPNDLRDLFLPPYRDNDTHIHTNS
ncbi:hypothetical protein EDB80DRAFT_867777 [Ilyonectria destructans]|nr:hypothetical protein EDB80DRAFT_867777 [Ilyonectria destructans]